MAPRRRGLKPKASPKTFACTGHGDCDMVFTRSEHLARHVRKHTGEKPYKCIIAGCDRSFSRYDNMIQHTNTHNRRRNRKVNRNRTMREEETEESPPLQDSPSPMEVEDSTSSMVESRTLPFPPGMPGPSTSLPYQRYSWPVLHEYSYDRRNSLPMTTESAYVPPPIYDQSFLSGRRSSTSTISSSDASLCTPILPTLPYRESQVRRRLSFQDIETPLSDFNNIRREKSPDQEERTITSDEYEALQGFSQLGISPVASAKPSPKPDFENLNTVL